MSSENVELVRRGIENVHVVRDTRPYPAVDIDGVFVGREAVIEMSRRFWGTFDDYQLDAEELIDSGSSVVAVVRERGRGKGSGAPFERRWAQIWTFRRGRIIRWELFPDRADALEVVGLSE
jgi:ketosteroid isomerase-like protein